MAEADKQHTRAKLQFYDALTQAPELGHLETRIAWRLLSYVNGQSGLAWPSYETLAGEVHVTRRTAMRCVERLVEHGWFIKYATGGGRWFEGRGQPNRYAPNWTRVTETSPLDGDESLSEGVDKPSRVTSGAIKGDTPDIKGDTRDHQECHPCHPNPSNNPSIQPSDANPSTARADARCAGPDPVDELLAATQPPQQRGTETSFFAWQGDRDEASTRHPQPSAQPKAATVTKSEPAAKPKSDFAARREAERREQAQRSSAEQAVQAAYQEIEQRHGCLAVLNSVPSDLWQRAVDRERSEPGAGKALFRDEAEAALAPRAAGGAR